NCCAGRWLADAARRGVSFHFVPFHFIPLRSNSFQRGPWWNGMKRNPSGRPQAADEKTVAVIIPARYSHPVPINRAAVPAVPGRPAQGGEQMRLQPVERLWQRVAQARDESDTALFHDLVYGCEMVLKLIVAGLVASLTEERDRHRYRHLYRLVRAFG